MCDFATDATEDATLEGHHVSTTPADAPNVLEKATQQKTV